MKRFLSPLTLLALLTLLGALLRTANLYWGSPFWFHPDERNIASAITRLSWPDQMDPDFFAYGTVPIYINFFIIKILQTIFNVTEDPFFTAIKVGRWLSTLLSTALIPLTYWITKRYFNNFTKNTLATSYQLPAPLIAALLATFTFGFIQYAHFGTFEIWLTFFYLLLFITTIELARTGSLRWLFLTAIIFGLATGTKITTLILLPLIILALLWHFKSTTPFSPAKSTLQLTFIRLIGLILKILIFLIFATSIFIITNPYALNPKPSPPHFSPLSPIPYTLSLLNPAFIHSINVEGGIARGTIDTFYTRSFTNTLPGLFHLWYVYPWALSWPVTLIGVSGLMWFLLNAIRVKLTPPFPNFQFLVLSSLFTVGFFATQFIFNSTLFVKWTRYTIPTLPFLILGASLFLSYLFTKIPKLPPLLKLATSYLLLTTILWHLLQALLFTTIYLQPDPRIAAAGWLRQHYPRDTKILSEVWDMGIVPANPYFDDIDLFNFYELDDSSPYQEEAGRGHLSEKYQQLKTQLADTDLLIIPSRRIWKNSLDHPDKFPHAASFYNQLFSEKLGFVKVAEFSNSPRLGPFTIPTELLAEETFSVFDHPTVQVWAKQLPTSQ